MHKRSLNGKVQVIWSFRCWFTVPLLLGLDCFVSSFVLYLYMYSILIVLLLKNTSLRSSQFYRTNPKTLYNIHTSNTNLSIDMNEVTLFLKHFQFWFLFILSIFNFGRGNNDEESNSCVNVLYVILFLDALHR